MGGLRKVIEGSNRKTKLGRKDSGLTLRKIDGKFSE
jgi:hypothetical protein